MPTGAFLEGHCHLALRQYETEHGHSSLPATQVPGATPRSSPEGGKNLAHRPPSSGAAPALRKVHAPRGRVGNPGSKAERGPVRDLGSGCPAGQGFTPRAGFQPPGVCGVEKAAACALRTA